MVRWSETQRGQKMVPALLPELSPPPAIHAEFSASDFAELKELARSMMEDCAVVRSEFREQTPRRPHLARAYDDTYARHDPLDDPSPSRPGGRPSEPALFSLSASPTYIDAPELSPQLGHEVASLACIVSHRFDDIRSFVQELMGIEAGGTFDFDAMRYSFNILVGVYVRAIARDALLEAGVAHPYTCRERMEDRGGWAWYSPRR